MSALLLSLLLLSAAPPATALRIPDTETNEAAEEQAIDLRLLSEGDAAREQYEEGLVREYNNNFSLYRTCNKSMDKVSLLAPLLIPELKLAFCYIPKAACSQFKDLFNAMNRIKNAPVGFGLGYLLSTAYMLHFNRSLVTKENGWKFAVFTRDPALRYLSAYGSTCVAYRPNRFEHPQECCGPLVKNTSIAVTRMVDMFQSRVWSDYENGNVMADDHWSSQVNVFKQCGWEHFNPSKVDFHGDISGRDVNQQVKDMLSLNGPINETVSSLVDRFFPKHGAVAGHKSPFHRIHPEMFYNDKKVLKALMAVYSEDYDQIPGVGRGFTDEQLAKTDSERKAAWAKHMRAHVAMGRAAEEEGEGEWDRWE